MHPENQTKSHWIGNVFWHSLPPSLLEVIFEWSQVKIFYLAFFHAIVQYVAKKVFETRIENKRWTHPLVT